MAYTNPYAQAAANQNKKRKKPTVNPTSMYNPQQQRTQPQMPASQSGAIGATTQTGSRKALVPNPMSMYNPQARPQMPASQAVVTDPITQAMMPDASTMYNAAAQPAVDPTSMFNP